MAYPKHLVAPDEIITGAGPFDGKQLREEARKKHSIKDHRISSVFATAASGEKYKNNGLEKI